MERQTVISIRHSMLYLALAGLVTLSLAFAACGGGDGGSETSNAPKGSGKVITPTPFHMIIPASGTEIAPQSTPTPTAVIPPTATPIPPLRTIDEEVTGELVDNISADEFPRTNARVLERSFRREEGFAEANIGKSFLIQGEVIIADRRDDGAAFVEFKAGRGKVVCDFEIISDAELRRFTPDGTNAVTGTVAAWDPESRVLEFENCRVVLGF
jgi:hypothetical protein